MQPEIRVITHTEKKRILELNGQQMAIIRGSLVRHRGEVKDRLTHLKFILKWELEKMDFRTEKWAREEIPQLEDELRAVEALIERVKPDSFTTKQ